MTSRVESRDRRAAAACSRRRPRASTRGRARRSSSSRSSVATDSVRGAGLGLAIARGFAEVNGARVWAENGGGRALRARAAGMTPHPRRRRRAADPACAADEPARSGLRRRNRDDRRAGVDSSPQCDRLTPSSSTSFCRTAAERTLRASSVAGARPRSSCSRSSATRARRSRRSTQAQTTMSRSRSASTSCSHACVRRCAVPSRRSNRCSTSASCASTSSVARSRAAGERVQLTPHEYEPARTARAQRRQAAHAQGDPP